MDPLPGKNAAEAILLQTLLTRLQIRSRSAGASPSILSQSLEDILLQLSDDEEFSDEDIENTSGSGSLLSKEEAKLEKEIVKIILSGNTESLFPNTGKAVNIGEHQVCIQYHIENGSDYRVWEWHGHIMLFDEENDFTAEYIYGNYFERLVGRTKRFTMQNNEEEDTNQGLRELIDSRDFDGAHILHRNISSNSPRY